MKKSADKFISFDKILAYDRQMNGQAHQQTSCVSTALHGINT